MNKTPKRQESEDGPDPEEERRAAAAANRLEELRLVLLGWRWPGKSLTGNTILGREEFRLERAAEFCVKRQTEAEGRQVTVVDTPGWFSSQNTPPSYQQEILKGASMCEPGPHAFLLVIPVGMFSDVDRARVQEHMALFGERVWRHTLVVFTWSEVLKDISIERFIRREGRDLQWVLERCGKRYFVINNNIWGEHPQLGRLLETVEKLVAEVGGMYLLEGGEDTEEEEKKKKEEASRQLEEKRSPQEGPVGVRDLGARPKLNSAPRLCTSKPLVRLRRASRSRDAEQGRNVDFIPQNLRTSVFTLSPQSNDHNPSRIQKSQGFQSKSHVKSCSANANKINQNPSHVC